MENNGQNNLKPSADENKAPESAAIVQNQTIQNPTPNLDLKRDELMSSSKISDKVSGYLKEFGGKNNLSPIGSPARLPEEKKDLKQSIVRTYKSDVEEAVKREKMSSLDIAIAEEKKKRNDLTFAPNDSTQKRRKVLFFIISLFLMFLGVGAFNVNRIKEKFNKTPAAKNALETKSLILADSSVEINLDELEEKSISDFLFEIVASPDIKQNSIQNINIVKDIIENKKPVKRKLESKEFLSLIKSRVPDSLFRSLSKEYMVGLYSKNGNETFVILKTDSYENSFAGMLAWEKYMADDLKMLLPKKAVVSMKEGTTTTEQLLLTNKSFDDVLIKNKDARALKNADGDIFLIYSLPDKETVLIASNVETLIELFDRIIRSRTVIR